MSMVRNYSQFINKFMSITGERHLWQGGVQYVILPENKWQDGFASTKRHENKRKVKIQMKKVVTKRGDDFSYLYHRIGVELLTMVISELTNSPVTGLWFGRAGALGEVLKYNDTAGLSGEKEKRVSSDLAAADSGAKLVRMIHGKPDLDNLGEMNPGILWKKYLVSDPQKYDHNYQLPEGIPPADFKSHIDPKFFGPTMTESELEIRLYYAVNVDSRSLGEMYLLSTNQGDRFYRGLVEYSVNGAKNRNLNGLLQQYLENLKTNKAFFPPEKNPKFDYDNNIDPISNLNYIESKVGVPFDFNEFKSRLIGTVERVLQVNEQIQKTPQLNFRVIRDGQMVICNKALSEK